MNPTHSTSLQAPAKPPFRILSLDGGGAKGFYTLGVLDELEKNAGKPLCECFDLIAGTSTGAIIAALLARGDRVEDVIKLYKQHVPAIMKKRTATGRTAALRGLAENIFGKTSVSDFKTRTMIVATNWKEHRPFVFKTSITQAYSSGGSFVPFFGCSVADAIVASCSASPFFNTVTLSTSKGVLELADGGFCANNPTLYAIADAVGPLGYAQEDIRVVSLGVGAYPPPSFWKDIRKLLGGWCMLRHVPNRVFLQKLLDTNTGSMDQLCAILYKKIPKVRISEEFAEPAMATDLLEHCSKKLERLTHKGRTSYEKNEQELLKLITT